MVELQFRPLKITDEVEYGGANRITKNCLGEYLYYNDEDR